jgi:hypothetical protein
MRTFLAAIIGILIGVASIWFFEYVGHFLFPVTDKIDVTNIEELKQIMFKMPTMTLIAVITAQGLGLLIGLIVARLIDRKSLSPLFAVSGVLLLMAILNLLMLPHPTWFTVTNVLVLVVLSAFYIGTRKKA